MTEKEWLKQAEDYEQKAREAYDAGDYIKSEMYDRRAEACRHNACEGTVETDK